MVTEGCYSGGFAALPFWPRKPISTAGFQLIRNALISFWRQVEFAKQKLIENGGWTPADSSATTLSELSRCRLRHTPGRDAPILYFGRLSAEKGVDDLLQAMQRLPHIHLIIAGDGPQRPLLEALVRSWA